MLVFAVWPLLGVLGFVLPSHCVTDWRKTSFIKTIQVSKFVILLHYKRSTKVISYRLLLGWPRCFEIFKLLLLKEIGQQILEAKIAILRSQRNNRGNNNLEMTLSWSNITNTPTTDTAGNYGSVRLNSKWICEFETHFKKSFCLRSNLSNDDILFLRGQVWKRVWILDARVQLFEGRLALTPG